MTEDDSKYVLTPDEESALSDATPVDKSLPSEEEQRQHFNRLVRKIKANSESHTDESQSDLEEARQRFDEHVRSLSD